MTTVDKVPDHRNYNADDYAYLNAKGWTDKEILTRWNEEASSGLGPCQWQTESARSKLATVTGRR